MASPSIAVIDALNSLLEAEANSVFHFVGPGSPYLDQASPEVRQPLEGIWRRLDGRARELANLIRTLGGTPSTPPAAKAEEQYLAFLSLKFLLPKLVEAKALMIRRYESVIHAFRGASEVMQLLERHLSEIREELAILKQTAATVAAAH